MDFALTGARIFDGTGFRDGKAVLVDGARVRGIVADSEIPAAMERVALPGGLLAPGFIDVQVNGGGGALLNDSPSAQTVMTIARSHRQFGTTGLLPTVITDAPAVTWAAIDAVRAARQQGEASVLGVHVEGPFLDPSRKGAHDARFIRGLTDTDIDQLANAGCGVVMLTVAPNKVSADSIRRLCERGIIVSLGHSDARNYEVRAALDAGASAFTHLFNAMSQLTGREPGMVGAALADEKSFIGIIADGLHVHPVSLKLALNAAASDRFMLVTDAMPPAAGGPDSFELQGRKAWRVNDRLQMDDGTLAGSNLTMDAAVRYCAMYLQIPLETVLQMASRNPARFLGREDLGSIAPGALANLVHLDDNLLVRQTWVEGK